MFIKALLAFLALPGMVAFAIPIWWMHAAERTSVVQPFGLLLLAVGCLGLLRCVRDFYVSGKGTLAPWSPPANLVVVGLYRYSRNPMYVSVLLILLGWAITFWMRGLLIYAVVTAIVFHLRVIIYEEPWLAQQHGDLWQEYMRRVPRWFGPVRG